MSVPNGTLVKPVAVQKISHVVAQSYECTCYCYRQVRKTAHFFEFWEPGMLTLD